MGLTALLDRRRSSVALLGTLVMAALMVLLAVAFQHIHPDVTVPWTAGVPRWTVLSLALAYALAERFMFTIEYRRQALVYAMSELPTAMALLYLGLTSAVLARVAGVLAVLVFTRRQVWFKLLFNAALVVFEMSLAYVVFHLVMGTHDGTNARFVFAMVIALVVSTTVDSLLVSTVISLFEGGLRRRIRDELRSTSMVVVVGSIAATMVASFSIHWPVVTPLGLVPVIAMWAVLRRHGRAAQQLRDYEALHRLSNSVSRSLHRDEIAEVAITEIQDLLRSDRAAVMLFNGASGALNVAASVGEPLASLPTRIDDPRWQTFISGGGAALLEPVVLASLGIGLGVKKGNVIVAPMHDDERTVGVLVIAERGGPQARFDDNDTLRAGAMADRLGAALRNAQLHEQIEHEAWRDSLTGLANRTAFERSVGGALAQNGPPDTVTVMMLGIDRFREVNETLGHGVGDAILQDMARRLVLAVGPDDVLARVAGDEFAILIADDAVDAGAELARLVVATMSQPFRLDAAELVIDVSIGLAEYLRSETDPATLLRRADVAMRWAKQHHTGVETYRPEIDHRTPEKLSLLGDLREALEHEHLDVHFQPKIDLVTGVVVGAEALVRWEHPTRGFVSPLDFVQLAETTGLITELTDQVIAKSVAAVRLLNDIGFRLDVSLNLSTLDLLDEQLAARLSRHLAEQGVPADQITLEITETALLEDGVRALETAEALQSLGSNLSIDDFGTGFSSLSYLRMLPASELKIDRSFVTNLLTDHRDEVIVRSTIDLGHNLGLRVAAEGVEDDATRERLRELGCDLAQGFGIARPLPLSRFVAWLTTSGNQVARAGIEGAWRPLSSPLDV